MLAYLVALQGATVTEYPLTITWVEHILPMDGLLHGIQNMYDANLVILVRYRALFGLGEPELVHEYETF